MLRLFNLAIIYKNEWMSDSRVFHLLPAVDYVESKSVGPKIKLSWLIFAILIVGIYES